MHHVGVQLTAQSNAYPVAVYTTLNDPVSFGARTMGVWSKDFARTFRCDVVFTFTAEMVSGLSPMLLTLTGLPSSLPTLGIPNVWSSSPQYRPQSRQNRFRRIDSLPLRQWSACSWGHWKESALVGVVLLNIWCEGGEPRDSPPLSK